MRSHYRSGKAFDEALHLVNEGMREGRIYNVRFVQAKETLGRAVHEGWCHVLGASVYGQILDNRPLAELFWALSVSNVHELTSAKKKLDATTVTGPVVEVMRAYVNECWPIALAMTELKSKTIAGRVPREVPLPVNPNRLEKTCACCFRQQAVIGGNAQGRMAHHGYERPGDGTQTRSCPGIRFQPLETSSEGLRYIIHGWRRERDELVDFLSHKDEKQFLQVPEGRDAKGRSTLVQITPTDSRWPLELQLWVASRESGLRHAESVLARLEKMLKDWRPEAPAVRSSGPALLPSITMAADSAAERVDETDDLEVEVEVEQPVGPRL